MQSDLYSQQKKALARIICDGTSRSPFYFTMKRGRSGHRNERAVIGHFQNGRAGGKVGARIPGMLQDTG